MKVLVSVRSLEEVSPAMKGGADIIDLKNPNEGSLGAAFPWVIKELRNYDKNMKLSVAIGDMPNLPGTASLSALGAAFCGADIIKVGLRGPQNEEDGLFLLKQVVKAVKNYDPGILVVGAGYADSRNYNGIDPMKIPLVCKKAGTNFAMLDTLSKDGRTLFDFLNLTELESFVNEGHKLGLLCALAGSLKVEHIKTIHQLGTDVIGFRGAACSENDRKLGVVTLDRVKKIMNTVKNLKDENNPYFDNNKNKSYNNLIKNRVRKINYGKN
ncbi:MAG: (5-formylfuran-3-yl)methyl phosphate synthase [Promethearchaeota archaeon]